MLAPGLAGGRLMRVVAHSPTGAQYQEPKPTLCGRTTTRTGRRRRAASTLGPERRFWCPFCDGMPLQIGLQVGEGVHYARRTAAPPARSRPHLNSPVTSVTRTPAARQYNGKARRFRFLKWVVSK
jgi:hypothetical protein